MKRTFLTTCALSAVAALALTSSTSCDENTLNSLLGGSGDQCTMGNTFTDLLDMANGLDCNKTKADYSAYVADMGSLLDISTVKQRMVSQPKDFSMAMVLNSSAINKLFRSSTEWKFGSIGLGLPTIQMGGCSEVFSSDYADHCISLVASGTVAGNRIEVGFGVPIISVIKGDDPSKPDDYAKGLRTTIFANFPEAQIVNLNISGVSGVALTLAQTAVNAALRPILSNYNRVGLFDISAWELGDGNIKLVAGSPVINEREGTMTLGMFSNINLGTTHFGEDARVTWEEAFPKDAEIGLHIHPDLIRGILGLMFHEGHVKDAVEGDTSGSSFKVTMASMHDYPMQTLMQCGENWRKYFTVGLRFWMLDNACGYADLLAGLNLTASESRFTMSFGNVQVGKSEGVGSAFKIVFNTFKETQTFKDILNFAELSFNYDQFKVPTQKDNEEASTTKVAVKPASDKVSFNVDGNGISLYLNFVDL